MKILLTGGGSGGHIFPLIAVSEEIKKIAQEAGTKIEIHYMGALDQHSSALKEQGVIFHKILTGKIRRYFSFLNFLDVPKFFIGVIQAIFKILFLMPDAIFSKGGPGALPVVFIGWIYRIPLVIHESDSIPGLTSLLSSRFARKICVSFDSALPYFNPGKVVLTGNPIRKSLSNSIIDKRVAKLQLDLDENMPLILVLGGSQGSRRINEFIVSILPKLLQISQVIHQTGTNNFEDVQKLSTAIRVEEIPARDEAKSKYEIVSFLDTSKMRLALSASDIVVSRAGSSSIFEIASFGRPSILVPLSESANNHQRENAFAYSQTGAGITIEEINLSEGIFMAQISSILNSSELAENMSKKALRFFKPDASRKIAEEILSLL